MDKALVRLLGSGFGLGLLPYIPGTFGTLLGVLLAFVLPGVPWLSFAMAITVVAGLPLARLAERRFGKRDPGWFVLDEVAGYLLAVCWVPLHTGEARVSWQVIVIAFVVFRIFDWFKPWPIRRFELLPGGWGVMMDDLIAGLFTAACVAAYLLLWR